MNNRIVIRDVQSQDLNTVLHLNEGAVPAVNSVGLNFMHWSMENACYFRVAERITPTSSHILGFMIGHAPDVSYDSENFTWFKNHFSTFVYVDRIVIAPNAKRLGIGTALYDDVAEFTREKTRILTCEVNTRPRNDDSLAFHHRYGFHEVGTQETKGGSVAVSLLLKELETV